jgi:hypothetical protein
LQGDWDTEDGAQNKRKAERGLCFLSLDRGEENLPPTLSAASVLLFFVNMKRGVFVVMAMLLAASAALNVPIFAWSGSRYVYC